MANPRSNDPFAQMQGRIEALEQQVKSLSQAPFYVPVLDADPATDEGNIWLMNDGRLRVRNASGTIKEYAPVGSPGGTTTTVPKPAPPAPKRTYTKVWNATWTQSYQADNSQRSDPELYYGYGDSFNGRSKALIGFDYANIASNLAGSQIQRVELYFHNLHSWWNWGSYIRFGIHNNTAKPATYGGAVRTNVTQVTFGKPQAKWATIATEFGVRFRDGTGRGVLIDQLTSDRAYYGFGAGLTGAGSPPMIRITYVK